MHIPSEKKRFFQKPLKRAACGGLFSFLVTMAFLGLSLQVHLFQLVWLGLGIGFIASGLIFFINFANAVRGVLKGRAANYLVFCMFLGLGVFSLAFASFA